MDLAKVMQALADRLSTIPDLRVYGQPPESASAPAAIVAYPDAVTFDETYGRGSDRMVIPVVVLVSKPHQRAARDLLGEYANGTGPRSVKAVLEAGEYAGLDSLRVTRVQFDAITVGTSDYMAAMFDVDIAGAGS